VPGIDRLPDLVDRARAAGLPVSLEIVGDPTSVAPIVDRSAFRIVQESVTNVMKHAPGTTATVQLDIGDNVVEIDVRNVRVGVPGGEGVGGADVGGAAVGGAVIGPSGLGGPGNGLIGMRERATAVGGTFSAGPLPDGGWRVLARLPRGEAAHARTTGGTTDRTTSGTTGGATDA
jgi:signal transduction histidine kinase